MIACAMWGTEGKYSKRARKNYQGEVSFDAKKSSKEDEGSVAQIKLYTDTGPGSGSERYQATVLGWSKRRAR